jgi:MFS transporter, DHA2 family, multidrug resistance protein
MQFTQRSRFLLVALTFGCLEVVLDKGQEKDWFSSRMIIAFSTICAASLLSMVVWELWQIHKRNRPIIDLRVFANRNFGASFVMMFTLGFILYASIVLLPQFLQTLMGYTAGLAGLAMSIGGLAMIIGMPVAGYLSAKVDERYLIVFGLVCMTLSLYYTRTLDLQVSFGYVSWLRLYQSIGLPFLFVPINVLAYVGADKNKSNDIAGLINLAKNLGGSCGTSFFTTVLARHAQIHQQFLVKHVYDGAAAWSNKYQMLTQHALIHTPSRIDAQHHALASFYRIIQQQAAVLAYLDVIQSLTIIVACTIPLVLLMRKPPKQLPEGTR